MFIIGIRFAKQDIQATVARMGPWAPVITIPIQAMVAVSPFPSDVLCITNGAAYGFTKGALFSWIGWWLASLIEFQLARTACDQWNADHYKQRLPEWMHDLPAGHPLFQILGRQIPGVGGHFTTIAAAAYGVSWRRFALLSAIAIIPGALLLPAIGAKLI